MAQSIDMDTIKLNKNNAATIEFNSPVKFVLIGNNPYSLTPSGIKNYKFYQVSELGNIVIIESKQVNQESSSITIKTQSHTYYGKIGYFNSVDKNYYSFFNVANTSISTNQQSFIDDDVLTPEQNEIFDVKSTKLPDSVIINRLNHTLALDTKYEQIHDVKGNVIFQVSNIVNDNQFSYIKLIIDNQSSSSYKVKDVLFVFEEGKKGGKLLKKSNEAIVQNWLNPEKIMYPTNKTINSASYENVGFVIPLYNGTDGEIILQVMEDNGTRDAMLHIKSKVMNSTTVFDSVK